MRSETLFTSPAMIGAPLAGVRSITTIRVSKLVPYLAYSLPLTPMFARTRN